ncbi:DinB family protein [Kocuria palustris]|uniref:DinB family protein n=1 Tax=Kocuria palustris TaxID=71999 RepID=UPI0011A142BB|nr:DinB family protein [Kocuria palustris]
MTENPMTAAAVEQLEWHWQNLLRPRLEGLTDDELFWDPTPDGRPAWTVHPADEQRTTHQAGAGALVIDFDLVEGQPQPFTTIAWRLGHVIVGVLAMRSHSHFDGPEASYASWDFATTAGEALAQLDAEVARWLEGLRGMDGARMQQPCGPAEGPWGERPFIDLALHINREVIHHLAEVALLRDLYAHQG